MVEDIEQICLREVVTEDDVAAASATLLDKDEGILSFMELARRNLATKKARERVFDFVVRALARKPP